MFIAGVVQKFRIALIPESWPEERVLFFGVCICVCRFVPLALLAFCNGLYAGLFVCIWSRAITWSVGVIFCVCLYEDGLTSRSFLFLWMGLKGGCCFLRSSFCDGLKRGIFFWFCMCVGLKKEDYFFALDFLWRSERGVFFWFCMCVDLKRGNYFFALDFLWRFICGLIFWVFVHKGWQKWSQILDFSLPESEKHLHGTRESGVSIPRYRLIADVSRPGNKSKGLYYRRQKRFSKRLNQAALAWSFEFCVLAQGLWLIGAGSVIRFQVFRPVATGRDLL